MHMCTVYWYIVGPRKAVSPNKTTLITDSSFYVCHVVFDELLKETGHGSRTIVAKSSEIWEF